MSDLGKTYMESVLETVEENGRLEKRDTKILLAYVDSLEKENARIRGNADRERIRYERNAIHARDAVHRADVMGRDMAKLGYRIGRQRKANRNQHRALKEMKDVLKIAEKALSGNLHPVQALDAINAVLSSKEEKATIE